MYEMMVRMESGKSARWPNLTLDQVIRGLQALGVTGWVYVAVIDPCGIIHARMRHD